MIRLAINADRCKACGLCIAHCPKHNLRPAEAINEIGYHATEQCDESNCTGCGICALMCPEACFDIRQVKQEVGCSE